jgi:single-strand DNA-binding protein
MSINKVILVGNVGKDPVIRYFDKGVAKATFPLATSESYTNQQGETITSTEWHNIVLWRALAEVAEKTIKKGAQVYIVGKIKTRSYVDKDGNNKYITEILADTLLLLEKKQATGNFASPAQGHRNDSPEKGSSISGVNEPGIPYNAGNENNKNRPETGVDKPNDFPGENSDNNGLGSDMGEDDLPF